MCECICVCACVMCVSVLRVCMRVRVIWLFILFCHTLRQHLSLAKNGLYLSVLAQPLHGWCSRYTTPGLGHSGYSQLTFAGK